MCTTKNTKQSRIRVGVVLSHGPVHPVVLSQHILVDMSVHSLPGPPCGERPPSPHVCVQDSVGKEIVIQVGGAFQGQSDVGEHGERVGPHHWGVHTLVLREGEGERRKRC